MKWLAQGNSEIELRGNEMLLKDANQLIILRDWIKMLLLKSARGNTVSGWV